MKKIILTAINAKYVHSNPGVYSLCAYAKQCNPKADIETLSFTINQDVSKITEEIYAAGPDLIGFSCYIWNITVIRQIVTTLSKILPKTQIWLGGPEVSYCADEMLSQLPVTGILSGEGEIAFAGLVREFLLGEDGDYRKVKGIVTRDFATGEAELIPMDDLPFFYQDFPDELFDNKILYYETSRGCPYMCTYCLSSVEKHLRFKSLPKIYRELQFFLDRKVKQVKFVDRTFNCDPDHAIAIWKYLKEHDNRITNFHFEIAAETMREDALKLIG
ncbi:MAG: cobalamin-dependent protein, partial [Parasporobacterium sp.]|nr:cobalamin-dependent protein [Parasporobacterium sp.]